MTAVAAILAVAFFAALGWGAYWRWQAEEPQDETWAARFETEVWKGKATSLESELATAYEALNSILDEHALCPAPVRPTLTVVPPSGEVTNAEWPAIMRAVEGEVQS